MLTPLNGIQEIDGVVKAPQTWIGKSTDAKPADPANGECVITFDGKILFYDAESAEWVEWGASS